MKKIVICIFVVLLLEFALFHISSEHIKSIVVCAILVLIIYLEYLALMHFLYLSKKSFKKFDKDSKKGTIFFVSRDENCNLVLGRLRQKGYNVIVMRDIFIAYIKIKDRKIDYDLIIIDRENCWGEHPTYNGDVIAEISKKTFPLVPVIGFSDYPQPLKLADDYAVNPVFGGIVKNINRLFSKYVIRRMKNEKI